jgi:hypothetical protein
MPASRLQILALMPGVAALAACTSIEQSLIERGYPPAYAQGYAQGCASGKAAADGGDPAAAPQDRDQAGEGAYAEGWDAGFARCRRDRQSMLEAAVRRRQSKDR